MYRRLLEYGLMRAGDAALGTSFIRYLHEWRGLQLLGREDLDRIQRRNLADTLRFATERVPYYRERNIRLEGDPVRDLRKFPIIRKKQLKERLNDFVAGDPARLRLEKSSGSSGIQGAVYVGKEDSSRSYAVQTLWWEWAGYRFGKSILQTGVTPNRGLIKTVKDALLRTKYVSAFALNEEQILELLRGLQRDPMDHFGGYASSLYVFASTARRHAIYGVRFQSAISWGDKLFPHFRRLVKEEFGCHVHDTYGCTEGMMIAGECEQGSMHVMTPHVYVEILDEDGNPSKTGELGRVVVTRLDNFNMPLIRYYLGDLAVLESPDASCPCGRGFPLMRQVVGRDTDIVYTPSGKYMVVHFFTGIFEHVPEIRQFRVVQESPACMTIEYIPDTGFRDEVLRNVESKIHSYLGEPFPIDFKEVDHIPATASGKPQIVQSKLVLR